MDYGGTLISSDHQTNSYYFGYMGLYRNPHQVSLTNQENLLHHAMWYFLFQF